MASLPVFPLNTVFYPGVRAPLHIFEERYRTLMRDLLSLSDATERVFVIVAIREGYEVGDHAAHSLHRVGCVVHVTSHHRHSDGRYDIEVVGRDRIRLDEVDTSGPYLRADGLRMPMEKLIGPAAGEAAFEATRTIAAFGDYRDALAAVRGGPVLGGDLPQDPEYLSYALSATCLLNLAQRQELLEIDTTAERLRALRTLMRAEERAIQALPSLPATEVARTRWSPN